MTNKQIYSYRKFVYEYMPKKHEVNKFNRIIEDFVYRYNSNKDLYHNIFGERYINNLIQTVLPKIIDKQNWYAERHVTDIWHIYIIGNWNQRDISKLQRSDQGTFHYALDWQERHAHYYNNHCYTGEY